MSPIAIIGIGCRFPKARRLDGFWRLLSEGVDAVTETPADRWDAAALYDPRPQTPGKMNSRWGAYLEDLDQFDPAFFGISPREAIRMDPQQRLGLEITHEALEDAGLPASRLAGSAVGVYIGFSSPEYYMHNVHHPSQIDEYTNSGNTLSMIANRISYVYDLRGPSMSLDTACSSSLTAIHLACRSLENRETALAIAGGVNLMFAPLTSIGFSQLTALSPDGRCRSFDARANGYVRGEGVGLVILKRLEDALADGDRIHAVVRGAATNSDGRSNGITAPNRLAQEAVLRAAYRDANISPGRVQYVEAHGSGTLLGDPIEANALGAALATGDRQSRCAIGAVKSNIGHAEAAAGVAGLIKTVLAMKHGRIPASLHFQTPNPHIDFDRLPLRVQAELGEWPAKRGERLAGVSSFGYGGSNAHVVLGDAASSDRSRARVRSGIPVRAKREHVAEEAPLCSNHILTISGRTAEALADNARALARFLENANGNAPLDAVCYTASALREHYDYRLSITAPSKQAMRDAINKHLAGQPGTNVFAGRRPSGGAPKVGFVYRGPQGDVAAWARDLYQTQPVFRAAMDECRLTTFQRDARIAANSTSMVDDVHEPCDAANPLVSLFAFEYALTRLWNSWGVKPQAAVGHWLGVGVSACIAGEMSPEEALEQIAAFESPAEESEPELALFTEMEELESQGYRAFLEIGPGPAPATKAFRESLTSELASLYALGIDIDWRAVYGTPRMRVSLPSYCFQRKRYWITDLLEAKERRDERRAEDGASTGCLKRLACAAPTFEIAVSADAPEWAGDHRVQGLPIFPAAAIWDTVLAAASELSAREIGLVDVSLERAIVLSAQHPYTLQLVFLADDDGGWAFQLFGRGQQDAPWVRHAVGRAARESAGGHTGRGGVRRNPEELRGRLLPDPALDAFYAGLARRGLEYGPAFRGICELWRGDGEALGRLELPESAKASDAGHRIHPALLDAALQVIGAAIGEVDQSAAAGAFVPTRVESVQICGDAQCAAWSAARVRLAVEGETAADVWIYDAQGELVVEVRGLHFAAIGSHAAGNVCSAVDGGRNDATSLSREELFALTGDERVQRLMAYLRARLAAAMETEADELPVDQPLYDLGLDSLVIFKLAAQIEGDLGLEIPIGELAEGPTISEFTHLMLEPYEAPL